MQQINLLNPHLLTPRVAFSSRTIAWVLLGVAGLGVAIYIWASLGAQAIQTKMDQAQASRDEQQGQIDALDQPGEDGLTEADKRTQAVAAVQQRLARLGRLRAALGGGDAATFSAKLRALSNEGLPGVWLTNIEFNQSGFRLEGRALHPSRVPDYLAVLARQPALTSLALSGFNIVPPEDSEETDKPRLPGVAFVVNPAARAE